MEVQIPCGKCIGCRLERSRQWALRCMHEASQYDENVFLTLTYSPEHLPKDNMLHVRDFQLFMKRLRKSLDGQKIRFFHCGEYGDKGDRPHYHAIVFNYCPCDLVLYRSAAHGYLFTSAHLSQLWGKGFVVVGAVTFDSCAYVARYVMKKALGKNAIEHYTDPETGEIRKPEYVTMSRRPGIGGDWIDKYHKEVFTHDAVLANGHMCHPPRYYSDRLQQIDAEKFAKVKDKRVRLAKQLANSPDSTPERLLIREECRKLKIKALKRCYESADPTDPQIFSSLLHAQNNP